MRLSQTGINLIKKWEGCRLTAYDDSTGVWTIGYGHTVGVKKGQSISQKQADDFLKSDLKIYEKHVTDTQLKLNQNQFDSLVSFTYNCGVGSLRQLIKDRSITQIGNAITLYNKAGGKVLQGLVNRRKEETALFKKRMSVSKPTNKVRNLKLEKVYLKGEDVDFLQKQLIALYFYPDMTKGNKGRDGIFGKNTDNAYRRWQSVYTPKLIDGIHGSNGRKVMNELTKNLV